MHPFIVGLYNGQSVKGNDKACNRSETSTSIRDGDDHFILTETWLSAQEDEEKTVELAPSGLHVKSFPRQLRSHGGGNAPLHKSISGSNIIFITYFDFINTLL